MVNNLACTFIPQNINFEQFFCREQHKEIYIAFAVERTNTSAEYSYESESPIYKWAGKHFDLLHTVKTHGARKVMAFITGNSQFLSFANFQDDEGETNIYTEIFKYDLHSEKFIAHQKILTNAATDIKFFCFSLDSTKESFLAIANNFEQGNLSVNVITHNKIKYCNIFLQTSTVVEIMKHILSYTSSLTIIFCRSKVFP